MNIENKSSAYKHRDSRFKVLFPKRVEKVILSIRSLKKLSNKTNYVYEEKQIYEALTSIIDELNELSCSFGLKRQEDSANQNIFSEINSLKKDLNKLKIKFKHQEWS